MDRSEDVEVRLDRVRNFLRSPGNGSEPTCAELQSLQEMREGLEEIRRDQAGFAESRHLIAELAERRRGRAPRDASERVVLHMAAFQDGPASQRDHHLEGLFKALVRVAELEGHVPSLDPSLDGSLLLEEAAHAHRRWRQGGSSEEAADAYRRALEDGTPEVLHPYLHFWLGHLLSVSGRIAPALETYRRLLEIGPPGVNGKQDVERRIRLLEEKLVSGEVALARRELDRLREEDRLSEGVEVLVTALHKCADPAVAMEFRRLLALTLTELGELPQALQEWERIAEDDPAGARVPIRALRSRIESSRQDETQADFEADAESEPSDGACDDPEEDWEDLEDPEDPEDPEEDNENRPSGRSSNLDHYRGEEAEVELSSERVRYQEDLARRLDEAGKTREAVLAYRQAYLAAPQGREQERLRKLAAALAWHRLGDPVLASEALAGLPRASRVAPDVRRLEEALHSGVVEKFRGDVRLGLRTEAFEAVAALFRTLEVSEPLRRELFRLHLEELSSCVYRRWQLRKKEVEDELLGYRSQGLGGTLVRLPNEAEGSPRHLAELEEELSILEQMGKALKAREWAVLRLGDVVGQARRLEDREGIWSMTAILEFVREVAERRVRHGQEKPVAGWRDRIASWLPESARGMVLSREGQELNLAQEDLLGQFEAFLDLRYAPRRG